MSASMEDERITIIGAGRLGRVLGRLMKSCGLKIDAVVDNHAWRRIHCATELGVKGYAHITDIDPDNTLVFICVPDDAIADVAADLAAAAVLTKKTKVVHTSGLLASDVLAPLKEQGMLTASFHPCYSFTGMERTVAMIYVALEGHSRTCRHLEKLISMLGWRPFYFADYQKPLYHAACVMASNYLIALLSIANRIMEGSGVRDGLRHLMPLIEGTLTHTDHEGPADALTGPVVRGDAGTIKTHLEALAQFDENLLDTYIVLGEQALRLSERKIGEEKRNEIQSLLHNYRKRK